MILGRDLWDTIAIVIALDTFHDNFETTTSSLLKSGNKTIDQMQSILQLKEAKNISKRTIEAVEDLAILLKNNNQGQKRKATSENKCFNCQQLGHFGRDCPIPNKQYPNNRSHTPNFQSQNTNRRGNRGGHGREKNHNNSRIPNQANQATVNHDNSDLEPFTIGPVATAFMVKKQQLQQPFSSNTWFLDLCALRHLCNDHIVFTTTKAKSIDFVIAASQVIHTKKIRIVSIPLANGNTIKLQIMALAPNCDSNLISLGQLQKSGITYYNDPSAMILMRNGEIIALARREKNLFMLKLARPGRAMATISQKTMAIIER